MSSHTHAAVPVFAVVQVRGGFCPPLGRPSLRVGWLRRDYPFGSRLPLPLFSGGRLLPFRGTLVQHETETSSLFAPNASLARKSCSSRVRIQGICIPLRTRCWRSLIIEGLHTVLRLTLRVRITRHVPPILSVRELCVRRSLVPRTLQFEH